MGIKSVLQTSARKSLETIDKGLKWAQDHPVALERTVLVVGTIFATRLAFKRFTPTGKLLVLSESLAVKPDNGITTQIIKSITPEPYPTEWINEVFHLEVTDADMLDMNEGMGMVFNIKNFAGVPNIPIAVVPYQGLMKTLLKGNPDFPLNETAEALLAANKG